MGNRLVRWLLAAAAVAAGVVVALYALAIGALARMDIGGVDPAATFGAVVAFVVGIALAVWILRTPRLGER
jgi:hypothetical protein